VFGTRQRLFGFGGVLLTLGAGLVVSALLLEIAVLILFGPQVRFPRHVVGAPWGLRINEPGASYRHKSADIEVWFQINGQGMRDRRDFAYEKPPGTKRIVVLGDSFTAGYEVAGDQTYPSVLERELRKSGQRVEVLNTGVSGFGNAEELLYLERELWKYAPDLVVLSFYTNDFADNVRSGLFRLDDTGRLVEDAPSYVPAGGLGDFLNTNPIFNWLSGYSNAFAFVKERLNEMAKRQMIRDGLANVNAAESEASGAATLAVDDAYDRRLAVAILGRLADWARERGIPLVIQSIPFRRPVSGELVETFPKSFDMTQPGVWFLPAKSFLDPYVGDKLLYWTRSHGHWTPFAHARSGEALAALVTKRGLLAGAPMPSAP